MTKKQLEQLRLVFESYPEIKLVYFFGSKSKGESGPMSDYDFAFYLAENNKEKVFKTKFSLQDKLGLIFKTDKIDAVALDVAQSPELKFNIIKDGELIYEKEPYRVLLEPKILNEYFDFHDMLLRHGLTKM